MTEQKDSTEQRILDAAHNVFLKKGLEGTRMQEIADNAGINKAMLHYYFRSKQKLFEAIFQDILSHAFPDIKGIIFSDLPFEKKITGFVEKYTQMLVKNPYLPSFILKEINRDPQFLARVIKEQGVNPVEFLAVFEKEMEAGIIRKMDPKEIVINLIALIVFPFAAGPMLNIILFKGNDKLYNEFLISRKHTIVEFVSNSIII
jgi:AcrR family transcriptional regulator